MKVVLQRVSQCAVTVNNTVIGQIKQGILVLLGIEDADTTDDIEWLCNKIVQLRIFDDENKVMNKSVAEVNGEILVVSQFTLMASTKKGNRPSYIKASKPEIAIPIYNIFLQKLQLIFVGKIATGAFGADMQVNLCNDGPVTIVIDSKCRE
jgi:D-tyrosyl-tRNA(Tyr) deacylase